ncbi:hypothetical protein LZC95_32260 [Pendulispora brunnea]|uniref:Uncharacterized protein n=1 Tax=Pendulispora brunnea TaxID=2905690 RepID=A0ABZ2K429_9BACT
MQSPIKKGFDPAGAAGGLATFVSGTAALVATATGTRFAWRGLELPEWLVYAAGALLLATGAFLLKKAFQALQCSACGKVLEDGHVIFSGDEGREVRVLEAVHSGDVQSWYRLHQNRSDDFSLKLEFQFCDKCHSVARMTLLKDDSKKLVEGIVLSGEASRSAVSFLKEKGTVEDDD